jgi:hypothetical protein
MWRILLIHVVILEVVYPHLTPGDRHKGLAHRFCIRTYDDDLVELRSLCSSLCDALLLDPAINGGALSGGVSEGVDHHYSSRGC